MIIAILFFIAYSCICFFAPNIFWVAGFAGFNLVLSLVFFKRPLQTLKSFIRVLIFSGIVLEIGRAHV